MIFKIILNILKGMISFPLALIMLLMLITFPDVDEHLEESFTCLIIWAMDWAM